MYVHNLYAAWAFHTALHRESLVSDDIKDWPMMWKSANGEIVVSLLEAVVQLYKRVMELKASQNDRRIVIIGGEGEETTVADQFDFYVDLSRTSLEKILKDLDDDTLASSLASSATINMEGYHFGGPQATTEEIGER